MSRYSPRTLTAQPILSSWGKGGSSSAKVPASITYSVTSGNGGGGGGQLQYPFNGGNGCGGTNASGTYTTLGARDYYVKVGAGGTAGVHVYSGCGVSGGAGGNSTFGTFTATGGGGGAGACGDHAGNCAGGSGQATAGNAGSVVITYTQTDTTELVTIPEGLTYTLSTNAVAGSYRYTFTAGAGLVTF